MTETRYRDRETAACEYRRVVSCRSSNTTSNVHFATAVNGGVAGHAVMLGRMLNPNWSAGDLEVPASPNIRIDRPDRRAFAVNVHRNPHRSRRLNPVLGLIEFTQKGCLAPSTRLSPIHTLSTYNNLSPLTPIRLIQLDRPCSFPANEAPHLRCHYHDAFSPAHRWHDGRGPPEAVCTAFGSSKDF